MPGTVRLHRVLTARPEKVYRAFVEADALAAWLPPFGFTCTVHELEPKVGGRHRLSFRNFTTGQRSCLTAIRREKKFDPINVVIYSTCGFPGDIEQIESLGATFVQKATSFNDLCTMIRTLTGR